MMWHEEYLQEVTTVITAITPGSHRGPLSHHGNRSAANRMEDSRPGRGRARSESRKEVPRRPIRAGAPDQLAQGQPQNVINIEAQKKKTRPPEAIHRCDAS